MSTHNKLYVKTELFAPRINGTDFATADWAFLGTVDQNLSSSDEVAFNTVSVDSTGSFTTKIDTGATSDYTFTFPETGGVANDVLQNTGSGVMVWVPGAAGPFDQTLNTTDDVTFNDVILTGDLTVQGTTTIIDSANLSVTDNVILVNKDEVGVGVTLGTAGLEVDRGSSSNAQILYHEASDKWVVGFNTGVTIGTDLFYVANYSDATQTSGAIPGYDGNGNLAESSGLAAGEVTQLQEIGSTTISATQWGYVGGMNQDVKIVSSVTFASAALDAAGLTVGGVTPTATEWSYLAAMNQSVATTDSVVFAGTTLGAAGLTVGVSTPSATQWAYISGMDQDVKITSSVTFADTTVGAAGLTVGVSTPSVAQWGYLTGMDQDVNTASSVTFANTTLGAAGLTVGASTPSVAQWANLADMDQDVATDSNVTFVNITTTGELILSEPLKASVSPILVNDPAPVSESINVFDTSAGGVAATLPANAAFAGKTYVIYLKIAGNDLTITRAGTDTIEGLTTFVLDTAGQHCKLTSIGDGTWIVS
jgi:hypothetical protein